uniref:Uncharacterized protein n=1 Tax=viral metagenome TaxID=1070528 RepID=A0A6C0LVU4_9ZZZZ
MTNLSELLMQIVSTHVEEFSKTISDEYGIDIKELDQIWSRIKTGDHMGEATGDHMGEATGEATGESQPPIKKLTTEKSGGCPYIFTKGKKDGCRCGSNAKSGKTYCSRHKKYEGQSPKKKKKKLPERKSIITGTKKAISKKKPENIVLHKGPDDYFHHRQTGLVFNTDRVSIGTWSKADVDPSGKDKIVSLTKENIEQAKKFGFQYIEEEEEEEEDVNFVSVRHVTRDLTDKLKLSLSSAISKTNLKSQDVTDILSELQINCDPVKDLQPENVDNESDLEEE